jgi:hypothetical protein
MKPSTQKVISIHANKVDRALELKRQMAELKNEYDAIADDMIEQAKRYWTELEQAGTVEKVLSIKGAEGTAQITRRDAWRQLDYGTVEMFQALLDEATYARLFESTTEQELTGSMNALIAEAEKAGVNVHKYFTVVEVVKPAKGFTQNLAHERYRLNAQDQDELDALVDSIRYKPAVVIK